MRTPAGSARHAGLEIGEQFAALGASHATFGQGYIHGLERIGLGGVFGFALGDLCR
ncbi:hypothetical protein D3C81_1174050 [compost metagenome]